MVTADSIDLQRDKGSRIDDIELDFGQTKVGWVVSSSPARSNDRIDPGQSARGRRLHGDRGFLSSGGG